MKIAIIGAGPSALAAAISIKSSNSVVIFERNTDAGKKLLLTGNGRCNIGNINNDLSKFHSTNNNLIKMIINDKNITKLHNFYNKIGLVIKNKNGYLYPFSEKSSSVLSCLKSACNAEFRFNTYIEHIEKKNNKFIINNETFDKVIIATGGLSYPKTGSTGTGYNIAKSFGHKITKLNPSLTALITSTNLEKELSGIRSEVDVSSYIDNKFIKTEHGEVQFTSYGLSGICIYNLSHDIKLALNTGKKCEVKINFCSWTSDLYSYFELNQSKPLLTLFDGFIDYKLTNILFKQLHISKDIKWCNLSNSEKQKIINTLTNFKIEIQDTKSYLDAQVTSGGISLDEINLNNLSSKIDPNIHFIGEILDLDGDCGGYNLTIAFITGILAGESC